MNFFFKPIMRLFEFVQFYERALMRLRNNKTKAHNDSDQTIPYMSTTLKPLEEHAAKIYTRGIFYKFRRELRLEQRFIVH